MPRTFVYKLTSDRGGAPCAPRPLRGATPLLTLSLCKPAIRRTAQIGDRLIGLTSRALEAVDGYPPAAVIYAAVVTGTMDAREYYAPSSRFRGRPDCVYAFDPEDGRFHHAGQTPLHADPAYEPRDLGRFPLYRNGRTVLSREFRYFGKDAAEIPQRFEELLTIAHRLGQGHRVFTDDVPAYAAWDRLWRVLWKRTGVHTPACVAEEAPGHAPRRRPPLHALPADA